MWLQRVGHDLVTAQVQFSGSAVSDSLQPHGLQHTRLPWSITSSQSLFKLMPIELVMPSSHLILCRPLLLPPSVFPSIRVFSNESVLRIRWPKDCHFSFSIRQTQFPILGFLLTKSGSVQFSRSVMSDSLRPHDRSTPGLPVHHQLPDPTQTHVH